MNARFLVPIGALLLAATGLYGGEYQRTRDGTLVWNNDPKPEDAASWSGERDKAGYATGNGILVWYRLVKGNRTGSNIPADKYIPISSYSGKMVRGKLSGPVAAADANGKIFHGTFVEGHRTRDWASGPSKRVRRGQLVEAPAPAEGPSSAKVENVQQSPTLTVQPEAAPPAEGPPKPVASAGTAPVSNSLRSLTAPPASLRTDLAAESSPPAASIPATEQPPPGPARTGLRAVEVIELADAEARARGYNLDEYKRPQVQYATENETWSISYDQKSAPGKSESGKHFRVTVDEKTRKAELKK